MKLFMALLMLLISNISLAQVIEVNWTNQFRKELNISCEAGVLSCERICNASSYCVIPEGYCRDCIGTSLKMNYLISEIGNRIQNKGEVASSNEVESLIKNRNFVTFNAQDIYNIIDDSRSTRAYRKFEKLCPEGSVNQILFLQVDAYSREIQRPEFVYCDFFDHTSFYRITTEVVVEREFRGPLNLF